MVPPTCHSPAHIEGATWNLAGVGLALSIEHRSEWSQFFLRTGNFYLLSLEITQKIGSPQEIWPGHPAMSEVSLSRTRNSWSLCQVWLLGKARRPNSLGQGSEVWGGAFKIMPSPSFPLSPTQSGLQIEGWFPGSQHWQRRHHAPVSLSCGWTAVPTSLIEGTSWRSLLISG